MLLPFFSPCESRKGMALRHVMPKSLSFLVQRHIYNFLSTLRTKFLEFSGSLRHIIPRVFLFFPPSPIAFHTEMLEEGPVFSLISWLFLPFWVSMFFKYFSHSQKIMVWVYCCHWQKQPDLEEELFIFYNTLVYPSCLQDPATAITLSFSCQVLSLNGFPRSSLV